MGIYVDSIADSFVPLALGWSLYHFVTLVVRGTSGEVRSLAAVEPNSEDRRDPTYPMGRTTWSLTRPKSLTSRSCSAISFSWVRESSWHGSLVSLAVILLGHKYGVAIVGVYALAQGISQCEQPVIDFGLRHVGARLMARFPGSASEIMHRVQRRRLGMAAAVLPFVLLYAARARLPLDMKVFLFVFAAISSMYALSLDWAAWGREQLRLVGLAKAIVPGCVLTSAS